MDRSYVDEHKHQVRRWPLYFPKTEGMRLSDSGLDRVHFLNGACTNTGYACFPSNNFKHF